VSSASSSPGSAGASDRTGGGGCVRCWVHASAIVCAGKGVRPDAISNNTQPSE
jgi:hypothetical protein